MTNTNNNPPKPNWKTKIYMLGAFLGAGLGFLSAYLFAKEAEDGKEDEERPKVAPTAMLGLALSALGLIRQIVEAGKKEKKK